MFAAKYLDKNNRKAIIKSPMDSDVGIIVVIPCFLEPDILQTLDSLNKCVLPKTVVEVIVIIN